MREPTTGERHLSIDAVRGMAVLGILLMNIVGMGLPSFAYVNPAYAGGAAGADFWTWAVNNVLTDGKMRALFTMLFGASTILIADRAERGGGLGPAATHYRRMFWLILFGLAHAFLFWFGDVLVLYALTGLLIFPLRKLPPKALLAIGVGILAALLGFHVWQSGQIEALRAAAVSPGAAPQAIEAWRTVSSAIDPPPQALAADLAGFGGDFAAALKARAATVFLLYTAIWPTDMFPEAFGQMLVGMALYRMGFFTLGWSRRAYALTAAFGYLACAPFTAWLAYGIAKSGFDPLVLHEREVWQQLTRPFIGLAHASVLLLIIGAGALPRLTDWLAAAGRMAFSNYLMTSIITSLVFCGYGFGLYGKLSRAELLWVVAGVWAFMLVWSPLWLSRFQYGPFEWAWRSLVQGRAQGFFKSVRY